MMRNTLRGHLDLSAIADRKAGVMLSVNSIIISVVFAGLVPRFHKDPELIIPTFILIASVLLQLSFPSTLLNQKLKSAPTLLF